MAYKGGMTRNFIKDEDISIDHIKHMLEGIVEAIRFNNKLNLTDINIICEEIFGNVLNELLDLKLVAASMEFSGRYVAVDLVDFERGIAFQVTSRNDRAKIRETIEKFNSSMELRKIRSLNILILGDGRSYQEPDAVTMHNGERFSFVENVFDIRRLEELIVHKQKIDPKILVRIYELLNMVFDSGRMQYSSIVKETGQRTEEESICDRNQKLWKKKYGDICLTAFIPLAYDKKMSCMLEFRKSDLSGIWLTFGEEELIEDYFLNEEDFIKRHNVGRYAEEEQMYMQIGHVRIQINAYTGYHIYQLFAQLRKEYEKEQTKIRERLGTVGLRRINNQYLIQTISLGQWEEMLYFARHHDCFSENGDLEWNIFNNRQSTDRLILSPCIKSNDIAGIMAELAVEKSETDADMLDLFWRPGYRHDKNSMDGFDNIIKWKADFTQDWVKEKFIPKAHEFYGARNRKNKGGHLSWRK